MINFGNCEAWLVTSKVNRRYFAKFASSAGMLVMTKEQNYYITDFRYIVDAKRDIKNAEVLDCANGGYYKMVNEILAKHNVKVLGLEFDNMTVTEYNTTKDKLFGVEFINVSNDMMEIRNVKTEQEIQTMIEAQAIADKAYLKVIDSIKEGVTEKQIEAKIITELYNHGGEGISFAPIVASGINGASPHAKPSDKPVQAGELITMDFGCIYKGYCSDMTRTVALGKISDELNDLYHTVLDCQLAVIDKAQAGIKGSDIHNMAVDFFKERKVDQYFGHGFGHGIGLDVHEGYRANDTDHRIMPENAVISAEPGLYIEGVGGLRIEDVIVLKKDGNQNITFSKKELITL